MTDAVAATVWELYLPDLLQSCVLFPKTSNTHQCEVDRMSGFLRCMNYREIPDFLVRCTDMTSSYLVNIFGLLSLQVTVTTIGDGCVTHFPGTSSAAPIAAGILALTLEVK